MIFAAGSHDGSNKTEVWRCDREHDSATLRSQYSCKDLRAGRFYLSLAVVAVSSQVSGARPGKQAGTSSIAREVLERDELAQARGQLEAGTEGQLMSDQMQSEIAEINQTIEQIDDPRRCYALVQERIRKFRQAGTNVPDDLARIERQLMVDCLAESQGR